MKDTPVGSQEQGSINLPGLGEVSRSSIALHTQAKKRSFLIMKPSRHLVLFKNGTFAYFTEKAAKAIIGPKDILKVTQEAAMVHLTTREKTYHFFYRNSQEASQWTRAFLCRGTNL